MKCPTLDEPPAPDDYQTPINAHELLHQACARGNLSTVSALLSQGAAVNAADAAGRLPLTISCLADQPEIAALLLAHRADINLSTGAAGSKKPEDGFWEPHTMPLPYNAAPLHAATLVGSFRCAQLLLEAHADVNVRTGEQVSPILIACERGNLDLVMLLSSYNADRDMIWSISEQSSNPSILCSLMVKCSSVAEVVARKNGQAHIASWLNQSIHYVPLQHLKVLSVRRTTALLRSGAHSPFTGTPSAAELAHSDPQCSNNAAAELVRAATKPWSPLTHHLWGHQHRTFAIEMCRLGYQLAYSSSINCGALAHVWIWHIIPLALSWETFTA